MSLHNMAVQTSVHHHAAFHVHLVPHFQQTKVRPVQCLFHGSHSVGIFSHADHGQADPIVRDTLIYLQFIYKRTLQCEMYILLVFHQCHNGSILFYDSGKHSSIFNLGFTIKTEV